MIEHVQYEVDVLDRHLHVLNAVIANEPIGVENLSDETGYAYYKIRYSLRILEEEDLIEPTNRGAVTTDSTQALVDDIDDQLNAIIDRLGSLKIGETGL